MTSEHADVLNPQMKVTQPARFSRADLLSLLVLGVLYLAAAAEAMTLGLSKAHADVIWPANGILLGMMLRAPRRMWAFYLLEISILDYLIDIPFHFPFVIDTGWVLGNIAEVTVAIFLLQAHKSKSIDLMEVKSFLRFFFCAVLLAPASRPLIIGAIHCLFIHSSFSNTLVYMRDLYIGDVLGIGIMTPLVLVISPLELKRLFKKQKRIESLALLAGFTALSLYAFRHDGVPIAFLIYPVLLLIVFRLGTTAAAIAVAILAIPAAYLTSYGHGPFSLSRDGNVVHGVLVLQLFLAVQVITVYVVGAVLKEREELRQSLQGSFLQMAKLAEIDFLSQLPNRRTLEARLQQEWSIAFRQQDALSLLMIDIDHFKRYNDEFGHPAGDALIADVAALLQRLMNRPGDFAARYGGEEFTVLLPRTSTEGAAHVAESIRISVAEKLLGHSECTRPVSVSVGVATAYPSNGSSIQELIRRADAMLYEAKTSGRNRIQVAPVIPEQASTTSSRGVSN